MKEDFLVTIFIPIYNGEKYIESTLNSILAQTYSNLEIILVDDSSDDHSLSILKTYAARDSRVKVFEKENSGMVPKILNYINPHINGDFFFYASQDDILSKDIIKNMIERHITTKADSVLPDMEFYYESRENNKKIIGLNGDRSAILSGKEAFKESIDWNIHGFALFNSKLVKEEFFPEDAFDSDGYITRKLFLISNKVAFCKGTFFYRQDNTNAITKSFTLRNFYQLNTIQKLYDLIKEAGLDENIRFKKHYDFLHLYFSYIRLYKKFHFKSKKDKNEIKDFLYHFKHKHLTRKFLYENLVYAIKNIKIKYLLIAFLINYNIFGVKNAS